MAERLDMSKFFGPPKPVPKGPPQSLLDGINPNRLDYTIPTPEEAPELWGTLVVGEIPLPLKWNAKGEVELSLPVKAKVDKKAKLGSAKPRVTKVGGEAIEGKATIEFSTVGRHNEWPAIVAAAKTLIVGSGPYKIAHPMAQLVGFEAAMVTAWDNAPSPRKPWTIHLLQVDLAAQVGKVTGAGGPSAAVVAKIMAELEVIEKEKAGIIGAVGFAGDPAISAALATLTKRRMALEAQLRAPPGQIVTPTTASGTARPGDVVPGNGRVAGAGAPTADVQHQEAQDATEDAAEP